MKDEKLYLIHMTECIGRIEFYTKNGREEFMQSTLVQDAVIRNYEVIGEAAKKLSKDVKDAFPSLPWKRIAGFRDVLIHSYEGIRLDEVWNIIEQDLPTMKKEIQGILDQWGK